MAGQRVLVDLLAQYLSKKMPPKGALELDMLILQNAENLGKSCPILDLVPQYVPLLLQRQKHWVLWKKGEEKTDGSGRWGKVPVNKLGHPINGHDPKNFISFLDACTHYKAGVCDGVGIGLPTKPGPISKNANGDPLYLVGIDLDEVVSGDGTISDEGQQILSRLGNSYYEKSPSGTGIRCFVLYTQPLKGGNRDHKEMYSRGRFLTVTGHGQGDVLEVGAEIEQLEREWFGQRTETAPKGVVLDNGLPQKMARFPYTDVNKKRISAELLCRATGGGWNVYPRFLSTMFAMRSLITEAGWPEDAVWKMFDKWAYLVDCGEGKYSHQKNRSLWLMKDRGGGPKITYASLLSNSADKPDPGLTEFPKGITAAELSQVQFRPLKWVIADILPEGCYLLSARPKVGKSWLALQICLAVAMGNDLWGRKVVQGGAIYLALEENQRRLQKRLSQLNEGWASAKSLTLHTEWPRFQQGGLEHLENAIKTLTPRVVVIDTLAKVRPSTGRNANAYEADYNAVAPLTTLASKYRCCILIVTHNRKGKSEEDALEQISGTLGLAGAVEIGRAHV